MANRDYGKKSTGGKAPVRRMADGGEVKQDFTSAEAETAGSSRLGTTTGASYDPPGDSSRRRPYTTSGPTQGSGLGAGLDSGVKQTFAMKGMLESIKGRGMSNGGMVGGKGYCK